MRLRKSKRNSILILSIGQSLRGDDAAGPEVVRLWRETFPQTAVDPRLRVESAELPGLALIDLLAGADCALLVDAVQSGAAPGTLHLVKIDELLSFESGSESAHGWGVAETLSLARQLGETLPKQVSILGIEAQSFEMGESLSEAVADSLPRAAEMVEKHIQGWLKVKS